MSREPWWAAYQRHRDVVDQIDLELDAVFMAGLASESETWFSKEGVRDCV